VTTEGSVKIAKLCSLLNSSRVRMLQEHLQRLVSRRECSFLNIRYIALARSNRASKINVISAAPGVELEVFSIAYGSTNVVALYKAEFSAA
jgi:hypothetical protein